MKYVDILGNVKYQHKCNKGVTNYKILAAAIFKKEILGQKWPEIIEYVQVQTCA